MRFTSPDARARYDSVLSRLDRTVVALDFDGTLSPVVDDPEQAWIHRDAPAALVDLAGVVRAVAVVTGRPVGQVLELGQVEALAPLLAAEGTGVFVFGQYGSQRWSAVEPTVSSAPAPPGLAGFARELPAVLSAHAAADAWIEDKGLAIAVHTRRLADADAAYDRLLGPVGALARRHGLDVEPGRQVIEVRSGASDKGQAIRTLVAEQDAGAVVFIGDDLGDLPAFEAVRRLRTPPVHGEAVPGLLVCSASDEQPVLAEHADVVVDGPDGVVEFLRRLASR